MACGNCSTKEPTRLEKQTNYTWTCQTPRYLTDGISINVKKLGDIADILVGHEDLHEARLKITQAINILIKVMR